MGGGFVCCFAFIFPKHIACISVYNLFNLWCIAVCVCVCVCLQDLVKVTELCERTGKIEMRIDEDQWKVC